MGPKKFVSMGDFFACFMLVVREKVEFLHCKYGLVSRLFDQMRVKIACFHKFFVGSRTYLFRDTKNPVVGT